MNEKELLQLKQLIESAYLSLKEARDILDQESGGSFAPIHQAPNGLHAHFETGEGSIVQGIFDGQVMVSSDGKKYPVPANYASKSKLVEGDQLKLTIKHDGAFLFKQIGPVERKRLKGTLFRDEDLEQYRVVAEGMSYKILTASITYFKGEPGDQVIILVPQNAPSEWGAVEHVLKVSRTPGATPPTPSAGLSQPQEPIDPPKPAPEESALNLGVSEHKTGLDEIGFSNLI